MYTPKQLSRPEDALDAIRGSLELFGEPRYILFSFPGLPCSPNRLAGQRYNAEGEGLLGHSLCLSLMWFSTDWKPSKPRDPFPSWRWAKVIAVHGSYGSIKNLDDDALGHFWDYSETGEEAKGLHIRAWSISNFVSYFLVRERLIGDFGDSWTIKNLYCHIKDTTTTQIGLRDGIRSGVYDVVFMMEKRYHGPQIEAYALVVQWD
ncbi:hypothetical protein CIB48_g7230 [Xylaria polymorpha]|nr:hypothetical protein CIB48_g7230 [Xylaria polymorpha]